MTYILLSILFNVAVFSFFRKMNFKSEDLIRVIAVNYFAATSWGFALSGGFSANVSELTPYIPYGIALGILFISIFFLIGKSVSANGVGSTTAAGKMSLILPVAFGAIFLKQTLNTWHWVAFGLAIAGVFLMRPKEQKTENGSNPVFLAGVFFGSGAIDTLFSVVNSQGMPKSVTELFNTLLFGMAGVIGLFYILATRPKGEKSLKTVIGLGLFLGSINYFSIHFLVKSLDKSSSGMEIPVVLGLNNAGIVFTGAIVSMLFLKEKLVLRQYVGLLFCLVTIWILGKNGNI